MHRVTIDNARLARLLAALLAMYFACGGVSFAAAHDFWVQPDNYWMEPRTPTPLTLQVGHGPLRQRSPISMRRITRFDAITPTGATIDLRQHLQVGGATHDGELAFDAPGSYTLLLRTDDHAQSHLPAIRFNAYLEAEGLTPALEQRTRTQRMKDDGSESYSRIAKSIVHVGPPDAMRDAAITRPLNLPLEIVPERNPYAEPASATLPVRIIYEDRPLASTLVKLTDLDNDAVPFETHLTDTDGRAIFAMPQAGRWLLNVIWTRPLPSSSETDFETVFSSLSFGFPDDRRVGG